MVACAAWAAVLVAAPTLAARAPRAGPARMAAGLVYAAGSVVCHQRAERSFSIGGSPMPVCARCAGIYLGALAVGSLMVLLDPRGHLRPVSHLARRTRGRSLLLIGLLPNLLTLAYEWSIHLTPANSVRSAAGVALGAAVMAVVRDAARPVVQSG